METQFTVRPSVEADWEILKEIRLGSLKDAPTAFGVTHATAAANTDAQWQDRAAGRGPARFLLAFASDSCIGMVGRVISDKKELNLIAMWVRPEYRGSGVASALVDAAISLAALEGHQRLVLDVSPDNKPAVSFYQRKGFSFLPEWEALESHPNIQVQKMERLL